MRLLILGGTQFVGRAIAEAALAAGHEVTLFNRGRTNPEAFLGRATTVAGDREVEGAGGLGELGDEHWDAVVDCCGYVPRIVESSCRVLRDRADRYVFISTGSVYRPLPVDADEDSPQLDESEATSEDWHEFYGHLKVGCERVVREQFGERALVIRPGIVFGPHDPTDRATWWVRAAARSTHLVVPDEPSAWLQMVDARDLGAFTVHAVASGLPGPYNVVGTPINLADLAVLAHHATGSTAQVVRVPGSEVLAAGTERSDFPLWVGPEHSSFMRRSHGRAANNGLQLRSISETLADVAAWDATRDDALAAGMPTRDLPDLARRLRPGPP